jgi:F-box and WD-40 domain protein CDC4
MNVFYETNSRKCEQILRGHTSTVRCIQSAGYKTVVSGSRDTTLRVWDLEKGVSTKVLVGHSSSVRCLAVHGDLVVSGSYDYTAMVPLLASSTYNRFGVYHEVSG